MILCVPVDDNTKLYVFDNLDDVNPGVYHNLTEYPISNKTIWVEIESQEPDDDGNYAVDEIEVNVIPTNAHHLIKFDTEYNNRYFLEYMEENL